MEPFLLGNLRSDEVCQIPCMNHRQLVEGTGGRHIEKLHIGILAGIVFLGRMVEKNRVKLQAFRVLHWQYHDAASKLSRGEIAVYQCDLFAKPGIDFLRLLLVPADHSDGLMARLLPFPDEFYSLFQHGFFIRTIADFYRVSVTDHGLHRVNGEISMAEDLRRKIRNLHGISVALFQQAEAVKGAGEDQLLKLLPVVEAIAEMDILGDVAHDRVGAAPETVGQHTVGPHAEILGLVDDHMAGLPDAVVLLDPLIEVSEGRQIVEVELIFREGNLLASLLLHLQKLLIHLENGTFPLFFPEMPPVQPLKLLFLLIRIGDKFSGQFIFQPCVKHLVEHVDFSLDRNRGVVFPISADHVFIHEEHTIFLNPDLL